jgi:hypothetical protein
VRLLRIQIEEFRSIHEQSLPADGLVVLFGPNSAGKTSVLEAATELIRTSATQRSDPGELDEVYAVGSLWFALPGSDIVGSPDAEMYRSLLCGEYTDGWAWDWLGQGTAELLKGANLDEVRAYLVDRFTQFGQAGESSDREVLARSIFDSSALFIADIQGVHLLVRRSALPGEALEAATRIAAHPDGDDRLQMIATQLCSHRLAVVATIADGPFENAGLAAAFPPVIILDGDTSSLSTELTRAIPVIHDLLWGASEQEDPALSWVSVLDPFTAEPVLPSGLSYSVDSWLEGLTDSGDTVIAGAFGSYKTADWYRVRHSILAVARVLAEEANRVAPQFVKDQGTVGIEVVPVAVWSPDRPRVRATFTAHDGERRDLKVIGAGTARWAAAAVRLAGRRLEAGRRVVTDESGNETRNPETIQEIVTVARQAPLTQTSLRIEPSDASAVYIADEPEMHLHPAAIASVRDWLTELAQTAATVLVASHSPILLNGDSQLVNRVLGRAAEEGTQLQTLSGAWADDLARVKGELGLTAGDLLLMTRLAVFVEGPHDVIVLDTWFGEELRSAGIRIFPVHGADQLPQLVESEIVAALGIRIATLTDQTDVPRARSGRPATRGERAVTRLLREAGRSGVQVKAVGCSQPDILYYLDEEVCRRAAPKFPGWRIAYDAAQKAGRAAEWKRWVSSQYDLDLSRENIRRLALECKEQRLIPSELAGRIRALTAYATKPLAHRDKRRS